MHSVGKRGIFLSVKGNTSWKHSYEWLGSLELSVKHKTWEEKPSFECMVKVVNACYEG